MGKGLDPMLIASAAIAVAVWWLGRHQGAQTGNSTWIPVDEPLLQNWAETADGMELIA